MWFSFLQKLVKWMDPKLEQYREATRGGRKTAEADVAVKPAVYVPKTVEEFIGVVKRTPKTVLSEKDRERLAAVMSFDERTVGDLMVDKGKMVFVKSSEMLGPLVLDKLYKSGFTKFPVIDSKEKVVGVINTEALNALEIRKMEKAEKYVEKKINYLHMSDSLKKAAEEVARTGGCYFLVLGAEERLVGFFTVEMLFEYLAL